MNITKIAEDYVSGHPSIADCLRKRLLNYSALSRQVLREHKLGSEHFDAVLIACRRYAYKIRRQQPREDAIRTIIARNKVEVRNKIIVAVLEKPGVFGDLLELEKKARTAGELFYIIEGSATVTLVTVEDFADHVQARFKDSIAKLKSGLALVMIRSPREIETVSGVLSFMTTLFAERGINILENMSCWTDTLFVIEEKDVGAVIGALNIR